MDNFEAPQGAAVAGPGSGGKGGQGPRVAVGGLTGLDLVAKLMKRYEDSGTSGVVEVSFYRGAVKKITQTEVL